MSTEEKSPRPRKRDAEATRASILEAATHRFAHEGYEAAGLREIAADAGVDASLISRYFGGKDELFREVLTCCSDPSQLFEGQLADFGRRVAGMLIDDPQEAGKLDALLIMLRSSSSPNARTAIERSNQERFIGPLTAWLGGEDAAVRARLAGNLIMGVAIGRALTPDLGLDEAGRERMREALAQALQAIVDPAGA